MTTEERNAELVQLQTTLNYYAENKTENLCKAFGYGFAFTPIEKNGTIEESYKNYLTREHNVSRFIRDVSLRPLNKENLGVLDLSESLCEWLFGVTHFASYRQRADELLDTMIRISEAIALWEVDCLPDDWPDPVWDHFLFEGQAQVFLLHLSFCD